MVDALDDGALAASMATIGQVEILAGPARVGDTSIFERTADEIRSLGIALVPLTAAVAEDAAWLRAKEDSSWPMPSTSRAPVPREPQR